MESFGKYFRRLVQGNAPQIFPGIGRNVENPGNYQLLVQEMNKITQDSGQAQRIAESLDVSDGEVFRDFDLAKFLNHFKLDSYAKTLISSALTHVKTQELRNKAGLILSNNLDDLLADLANARNNDPDTSPSLIATCALKYLQNVPEHLRLKTDVNRLQYSLELRYKKQRVEPPPEVLAAIVLLELIDGNNYLAHAFSYQGPQVTHAADSIKALVGQLPPDALNETQVANGLLFAILSPEWQEYDISLFISTLANLPEGRKLNWQDVIQGFDYKGAEITKAKFLVLFNAMLPLAREDAGLDIQALWGGQWINAKTQLSYLRAFLSCSPSELDATSVPRLRKAFEPADLEDGPLNAKEEVDRASRDTMISLEAVAAVLDLLVPPTEPLSEASTMYLTDLLSNKAGLFLCSLTGIPPPWTPGQDNLMKTLFKSFMSSNKESSFILHALWKHDRQWVALCLMEIHLEDPLDLVPILEVSREMGWLDDLLTLVNGFGIDLAALALRMGHTSLEQWLKDKTLSGPNGLITAISKFLVLKSEDELRTSRDEQPQPRTVSLSMKTVYDMLNLLAENVSDQNELKIIQRQCLQAYPRLIMYCEGVTEGVDVSPTQSNSLPKDADSEMQDLYKRMYNGELNVQDILEYLQQCKASDDPDKVNLFACMIHGLFDEFSCFGEYPLGPLATTAVLFGGIMQVRLISDLALWVAQDMVLDSVRDFPPDEKMYKFGLQALLHVTERFQEPEWQDYCAKLLRIPGLRGTQAYTAAAQAIAQNRGGDNANGVNGITEDPDLLDGRDGPLDGFLSGDTIVQFRSINVKTPPSAEEPSDAIQEKIVFFFNNVTEQNLKSRVGQVEAALNGEFEQWFAHSLVETRAKQEPNNQPLYMAILEHLNSNVLWKEVLRETLNSVQKLLNGESTMQSATDRKFLKNLSVWLGSLTLARDKPIRHKNIAFSDLLVEGYHMQKLMLVIPFTCNVLSQGARSRIFKPPNPWVIEVIAGLMELYEKAEIKLNLKFEIEVLLKEFGLQLDSVPPAMKLHDRQLQEEDLSATLVSDGLGNFDDLSISAMSRVQRNSRFDVDSIATSLPDLANVLNFPPPTGSVANQARLRQAVIEAVRRAILEIVLPVVERSVTIATIATTNLIHKDFCNEPDEERVRRAAHQMVRQLSGSLALVTCKEPLKTSMTNYIRIAQADLLDQAVPEGAILMCVNDNLDIACSIVEQQAEERSMPEIDIHIENEFAARRRHIAENPNEPFSGESYNRWANFIPEPYRQSPGGLTPEQMEIYVNFARQSRGPTNHAQTSSADSGRQLPDVLQDAFSSATYAASTETDAMSHQNSQLHQHQLSGRMLPQVLPISARQPQANGFIDAAAYDERAQSLMNEIRRIVSESLEKSRADQHHQDALVDLLNQTWETLERAPESVGMNCAESICKTVYGESTSREEIDALVPLLAKLVESYPAIRTEVTEWVRGQDGEKFLSTDATVALIRHEIVQVRVLDNDVARLIHDRGEVVLEYVSELLHELLLTEGSLALRTDFASILEALSAFYTGYPSSVTAKELIGRLRDWGMEDVAKLATSDESNQVKEYLHKYIFTEWTGLCESFEGQVFEKHCSVFISQLISKRIVGSQEETAAFLRVCIDAIIDRYDRLLPISREYPAKAFKEVDYFARFIVMLVRCQADQNGVTRGNRISYMDSVLSLISLIINHHAVNRAERFNQRVFFRLWSTTLCDWFEFAREGPSEDAEMLLCFAGNLMTLNPKTFPAFTFSWLSLISHRFFMPCLLRLGSEKVRSP